MSNLRHTLLLLLLAFPLVAPAAAHAALIARLGGAAVYDTDRNLTWLADANAGAGSAFDDGLNRRDGRMTLSSAIAWAASLEVAGVTGWRLPTTVQPDLSCHIQTGGGRISFGFNCSGSEMGHLFYTVLGGAGIPFGAEQQGVLASGDPDLAFFRNIQSQPGGGGIYHSSTQFNAANNWRFNFNNGSQTFENDIFFHYAWAVRDGDVGGTSAAVPAPGAVWLMALGLPLLVLARARSMAMRGLRASTG